MYLLQKCTIVLRVVDLATKMLSVYLYIAFFFNVWFLFLKTIKTTRWKIVLQKFKNLAIWLHADARWLHIEKFATCDYLQPLETL